MPTRGLVTVYVATMFFSALLLFFVQPLVGKLLVPLLGGAPAIWNTCMVFFQGMLLLGYLYAHGLSRLKLNKQVVIHMVILGIAAISLPLSSPGAPPQDESALGWLLLTLLAMIGAPFFAISTTAPLLQSWFSRTTHPTAQDPYHLYAASNLGSMTSLLLYPFLFEPLMQLHTQTTMWSAGYAVLYIGLGCCGVMALKSMKPASEKEANDQPSDEGLTLKMVGLWIVLSFVPSSLMLGATSYITVDIASIPLLWLLPLTLYLLTFILAFANKIQLNLTYLSQASLILIPVLLFQKSAAGVDIPVVLMVFLHLTSLFLLMLSFHGNLAGIRPPSKHLTAFFLFVSLGGVLGGVFNAFVAPFLFNSLLEYWIILLCGASAGVGLVTFVPQESKTTGRLGWVVLAGLAGMSLWIVGYILTPTIVLSFAGCIVLLLGIIFFARKKLNGKGEQLEEHDATISLTESRASAKKDRILSLVLTLAFLFILGRIQPSNTNTIHQERSFFGTHTVKEENGMVKLVHGTTTHGTQLRAAPEKPISYYSAIGPLGKILDDPKVKDLEVSIIGLGAGTIAAYSSRGHQFVFYEIDPSVIKIAQTPKYFTYLQRCGAKCRVEEGDGRLEFLRQAAAGSQDLLILDAYSSDAIPIHLATFEAIKAYWKRLKPDGLIAFHISNRHFNLEPVLAKLAHATGAVIYLSDHELKNSINKPIHSSTWMVMGRNKALMAQRFGLAPDWKLKEVSEDTSLWTDSYSNLLSALR